MILVVFFTATFANMTIDTFGNNLITSKTSVNYHDDPKNSILTTSPSEKFMFAIGITGMDLSSNQRYFDISLNHKTTINSASGRVKQAR